MSEQNPIFAALAGPFDVGEVKFKPAVVSGNRALALAYVDARVIQDRLDDVLGPDGWKDAYKIVDGHKSVVCKLSIRVGKEWVTKMDVGSASEQPDEGDRMKAAFSDALKRVAVKFGVGRYLYRFPSQWIDYDPKAKKFTQEPKIPDFAKPKPAAAKPPANKTDKGPSAPPPTKNAPPANGLELRGRLLSYDAKLAGQGLCENGDLMAHVVQMGVRAGYEADMTTWSGQAILLAAEETKAFEAQRRDPKAAQQKATGLQILETAAEGGTKALGTAWKTLTPAMRELCKGEFDRLKEKAADLDKVNAAQPA